MEKTPRIFISSFGSLSPLGSTRAEVIESYQSNASHSSLFHTAGKDISIFKISSSAEKEIGKELAQRKRRYLDRVALLALGAALKAFEEAQWGGGHLQNIGVSIGSARGATYSLEHLHKEFLESGNASTHAYTSPMTTAGGISSAVAQELGLTGAEISTSMTCASFLHSVLVSVGLLRSQMFSRFIVGGAEAPLTPFSIAQMQALRIYSPLVEDPYPCQPCALHRDNPHTMVLGEGAAVFCLETDLVFNPQKKLSSETPEILGIGWSKESIRSETGMDPSGIGLQQSMKAALSESGLSTVDAVIVHAPGTELGDKAELSAIEITFKDNTPPALYSTKYLTGHTLGASGALSLELALLLMQGEVRPQFPYATSFTTTDQIKPIRTCLINSAGFGGSIMSLVVGIREE